MHSAPELVSHIEGLTSLPSVYLRVREELESPESSLSEVARLISVDPALTTRLLRLVNSPLYGYGGRIDSVNRAVTLMGLQQVHDLVMVMAIGQAFQNIPPEALDMGKFWRASMICGLAAREIARSIESANPERMLVVGLLADVGHLVMYQTVPLLAQQARREADHDNRPLATVEQQIVGCNYAELGATLMDRWKLPGAFAQIIGAQLAPRFAGDFIQEAAIINLAREIVESDRRGETSEVAAARVDPIIWVELGLNPPEFSRIRKLAALDLASHVSMLFPDGF